MGVDGKTITVIYDGEEHTIRATATAEGALIEYSTDGGETWTTSAPRRKDVGTTEITIRATHPAYETAVLEGVKLIVLPRALNIEIDDQSKVYGDEDPELTATVTGLATGETLPEGFLTITREAGEDVGEYEIYTELANSFDPSNYDITVEEGTFTITPRTVTVTADDKTKTKGEDDPELTATVEGLVDGDEIEYTLSREEGEEIGTYTIYVEGDEIQGDGNYEVIFVPGTLTIVRKAQPKGFRGNFSLYFLSDTMIAGEGKRADAFKSMIDWAGENAASDGTIAMVGSGNVVAQYDDADAWQFAKDTLNTLPGNLPYYFAAGSSDVNGDAMSYDAYLAADLNKAAKANRFEDGQLWFAVNAAHQILTIGIGYQKIAETEEELERQEQWLAFVNNAIKRFANYGVVLVLNDYIDANGELTAFGKLIEENIVATNEMVAPIPAAPTETTSPTASTTFILHQDIPSRR